MESKEYEVIIIGSGPGGYVAAIKSGQLGLKTALIEKNERLGGTCLNVGCIPSKALLSSSELLVKLRDESASHGINPSGIKLDLTAMMKRKSDVVERLTSGISQLMKKNNVSVYYGSAEMPDSGTVVVKNVKKPAKGSTSKTDDDGESIILKAKNVVLATGSVPSELPFLPYDGERIIDSTDTLSLNRVPEKLLVLGAGPIGLELGSIWHRLGAEVAVIEIMDTILPGWDKQISSSLKKELSDQGIGFSLGIQLSGYSFSTDPKGKPGITVMGKDEGGKTVEFFGNKLLLSAGRNPYCPSKIRETLRLELDDRGRVKVNESFETSSRGVYAIGDMIHGPMLAHKAEKDGVTVAEIIAGEPWTMNREYMKNVAEHRYDTVPSVVYTSPEAASVGLSEEECKQREIPYKKGIFYFRANGKALAGGNPEGFVKVLSHEKSDDLLGTHIVGHNADLLLSETVTVMEFRGTAEDIGRTVHSHPSLSEAVQEAALAAYDKAIHR